MTVLCRRCRRPLTSPVWRARRLGPVCARLLGLRPSRACPTVLVRSARAEVGEGQMELFDIENERKSLMTCEQCQRPIADVFATDPEVRRHTTCPPGRCTNCKTEMPYADLERVELADGEIDPDPDLLVCHNVFACQVRAGERDPDDMPQDAQ